MGKDKCKSGFKLRAGVCVRKDPLKNFMKGLDNGKTVVQRLIVILGTVIALIFMFLIVRGFLELGLLIELDPGWKIFIGFVGVTVIIFFTLFLESVFGIKKK